MCCFFCEIILSFFIQYIVTLEKLDTHSFEEPITCIPIISLEICLCTLGYESFKLGAEFYLFVKFLIRKKKGI